MSENQESRAKCSSNLVTIWREIVKKGNVKKKKPCPDLNVNSLRYLHWYQTWLLQTSRESCTAPVGDLPTQPRNKQGFTSPHLEEIKCLCWVFWPLTFFSPSQFKCIPSTGKHSQEEVGWLQCWEVHIHTKEKWKPAFSISRKHAGTCTLC